MAAILVADVVGYSRLVEADEAGTLKAVNDLQHALFGPLVATHRGRIFKLMGDGLISEFSSVVDAVNCAVDVQNGVAQRPDKARRQIMLWIGINLGDVVVEGDDLMADCVNIAARLEQLCPPGDVLISGFAYDHLVGKVDFQFQDAGAQHLKNIARPIKSYHLALNGSAPMQRANLSSDKPVIAVLPFDNMCAEAEQIYFSDGMTEDIIAELSHFSELMVIARNSSFAFRSQSTDLREIGQKLAAG
ncbi:adenylate/guanylate cyclase domain-containing protein [Rhizobium sp. PL01]|uniref:adenylate/guanylate cyclase domain-containing protein n=1 Tax=Rhizobium sp. PL01 TaxID=3085631 RepID=UPI0029829457|nr:adenylate/guanylate cyclase domain-containing protein [Rhizobium sp. PL01]MDW5317036.1 adenylate/guanylate cyclase domain-containing protein [Rhizobium sp. PL01]